MKLLSAEKSEENFSLQFVLSQEENDFALKIDCRKDDRTVCEDQIHLPLSEKAATAFFRLVSENVVFPQHLRDVYHDFLYQMGA